MIFTETKLSGAYVIDLKKFEDSRGFFSRAWCQQEFESQGIDFQPVQANLAYTAKKGTIRGMHYQVAPHAEAKLFRCIRGAVYDVMVDLRAESETFGQWFGVELSAENRLMAFIPEGFAHGYQALTDDAEAFYMVGTLYTPGAEQGFRWNDPTFQIEWAVQDDLTISDKDQNWADFAS